MEGIRPCPYCHGEVEVIKLNKLKENDQPVFRIQCRRRKALVVKGRRYPVETVDEGEERIRQYEEIVNRNYSKINSGRIVQSLEAKRRDREARLSSRMDRNDL